MFMKQRISLESVLSMSSHLQMVTALQVFDPEEEQSEESAVVVTEEKGQKTHTPDDKVNFQIILKNLKLLLKCQILIIIGNPFLITSVCYLCSFVYASCRLKDKVHFLFLQSNILSHCNLY